VKQHREALLFLGATSKRKSSRKKKYKKKIKATSNEHTKAHKKINEFIKEQQISILYFTRVYT
jgi:hypothetical protein